MTQERKLLNGTNLSPAHKEILELIEQNGYCLMGQIVKELSLSYNAGYQHIAHLQQKGLVSTSKLPPYITLRNHR